MEITDQPVSSTPRYLYWLIVIIALALVGGIAGWFYVQSYQTTQPAVTQTPVTTTKTTDEVLSADTTIGTEVTNMDQEISGVDDDAGLTNDDNTSDF